MFELEESWLGEGGVRGRVTENNGEREEYGEEHERNDEEAHQTHQSERERTFGIVNGFQI